MRVPQLEQMSLSTIMSRWPETISVFVGRRFHCIGCPISDFHSVADAAREHHYDQAELTEAIQAAIDNSPARSKVRARSHRR